MNNKILHIFFLPFAALLCLCSCGLEEPIDTPQNTDGYVEFVARPVGYNNQAVQTKATTDINFENTINNCFFLIFDEMSGNRVGFHQLDVTSYSTPNIKLSAKGLKDVTACFIANVPVTFASNITTIEALNSAVLDDITYADGGVIGTPTIDLDSDSSTPAVSCIPMFGIMEDVKIESISTSIQIPLARLFAKVSVELTMSLNNTAQLNSYYNIHAYHIHNLPTKVKLIASRSLNEDGELVYDESDWVYDGDFFIAESSKKGIQKSVYNDEAIGFSDSDKYYAFDLYVPEYFLYPLSADEADLGENYATEKYKPLMYDHAKYPIYLTIDGIFTPSLQLVSQSQPLKYTVYFGEDDCSSFSMQRNTLYTNSLIIGGTSNNKDNPDNLDHRVETSPLNLMDMNGESSNCYLIKQEGTYYLPPYMGVFKSEAEAENHRCSGTTVEILHKDNDDISIINERYDPKTQCIVFDVDEFANGNVIIAIKNGNTIEWSWHLWLNTSFSIGGVGLLDVGTQIYPNGSEFMDRNLGASTLGGTGLFYQSGSKNPFINNSYHGGGTNGTATWYAEEEYIKDDNTTGVRPAKAIHDPCPPGYRMPRPDEWDPSKGTDATTDILFSYLISPAVGFTYTGFRNYAEENKESNTRNATDDVIRAADLEIKDSETVNSTVDGPQANTTKIHYRTRTITLKEYINIEYTVPTTQKFGGFWTSNDGAYFKYYNYRADWSQLSLTNLLSYMSVVKCDYREYKYSIQEKREKGFILWGSWNAIPGTETFISESITEGNPSNLNNLTDLGVLFIDQRDLATLGQQNTMIVTGENRNNGYQVRCIVD